MVQYCTVGMQLVSSACFHLLSSRLVSSCFFFSLLPAHRLCSRLDTFPSTHPSSDHLTSLVLFLFPAHRVRITPQHAISTMPARCGVQTGCSSAVEVVGVDRGKGAAQVFFSLYTCMVHIVFGVSARVGDGGPRMYGGVGIGYHTAYTYA